MRTMDRDIMREIMRRAWERGATAGNFAIAYAPPERDESGDILAPDGILSGEMAGESILELIPEVSSMGEDNYYSACDAYEAAYADGFVSLATWADSDEDDEAPVNPHDI